MTTFLVGLFVGGSLGFLAAALLVAGSRADEQAEHHRRRELLRRAAAFLDLYGESRHLAASIRRELSEDAGA